MYLILYAVNIANKNTRLHKTIWHLFLRMISQTAKESPQKASPNYIPWRNSSIWRQVILFTENSLNIKNMGFQKRTKIISWHIFTKLWKFINTLFPTFPSLMKEVSHKYLWQIKWCIQKYYANIKSYNKCTKNQKIPIPTTCNLLFYSCIMREAVIMSLTPTI